VTWRGAKEKKIKKKMKRQAIIDTSTTGCFD